MYVAYFISIKWTHNQQSLGHLGDRKQRTVIPVLFAHVLVAHDFIAILVAVVIRLTPFLLGTAGLKAWGKGRWIICCDVRCLCLAYQDCRTVMQMDLP